MRLLGDLLPFIGFRIVNREGLRLRGLDGKVTDSPVGLWELFEIEWLTHGFTVAARPVLEIA